MAETDGNLETMRTWSSRTRNFSGNTVHIHVVLHHSRAGLMGKKRMFIQNIKVLQSQMWMLTKSFSRESVNETLVKK